MIREFKEFALKGNVIDMAVGIIIGAAFSGVVKTLVDEVLMPPLGFITGRVDFSDKVLLLAPGTTPPPYATLAEARNAGAVVIGYGQLINAVMSFLLVALALFFLVRWINRLRKQPEPAAPNTKACPFCRSSIHQEAVRCAHCTSALEPAAASS
jgi:large conductance mechanosensitive channel